MYAKKRENSNPLLHFGFSLYVIMGLDIMQLRLFNKWAKCRYSYDGFHVCNLQSS